MADRRLLCTFTVAELLLGLDIGSVQEVLRGQEVTRLPLAADAVRGIINLRGRIIPALDLRRCLGLAPAPDGSGSATIVVRASDAPVSFLVDEVGDVVPVDDESVERPPDTIRPGARELMHGVVQLHDRLLLELDLGRVLRAAYA
ncbi:MAG TPA: chemotaxis protein CheW [Candidatus Limnocylindrales bacterium]|nr:chemotaxis protein CheW [Candidatus Limnocylindrales bacterium]